MKKFFVSATAKAASMLIGIEFFSVCAREREKFYNYQKIINAHAKTACEHAERETEREKNR